uniref:BZIP domain-containing protein n=1 Tax=Nelumbo nucifera TaxID=4432 RepID=A0A822ZV28_NELNU|nr:TPA_asm: hypothetical protein HUJ06_018307 [Nelumbo nucifera]
MSRQAHLPPRCPPQNRASSCSTQGDSDTNLKGIIHRRSASDSLTLLEAPASLNLTSNADIKNTISDETGTGMEAACIYGPNSPRCRSNLTHSKDSIVSALSEYVPQTPLQHSSKNLCIPETAQSYLEGGACGLNNELHSETKAAKRHSGQRSRVRKLQYIAELERTVNLLQCLESDLAARVGSLLQRHAILSMENTTLEQKIAILQKEKLIMDGQYQTLRKEVERLKVCYINHLKSKTTVCRRTGSAIDAIISDSSWQMLDIGKLSLGEN